MNPSKNSILWIFFFIICMGVGFLHGFLPQGLTKSFFISPNKVLIFTTDEIFFPVEIRQKLEDELHLKFSVTITRDWDAIIANTVSNPSVDLIFLPSFWAKSLEQQSLLSDIAASSSKLQQWVSSDFLKPDEQGRFFFLPIYWMKTALQTPQNEAFFDFLKNKNEPVLQLLADEDLLLQHFKIWKDQGLWDLVAQKKILTLQLDRIPLNKKTNEGAVEIPLTEETQSSLPPNSSALLVWGASIPENSQQKKLALKVLETLATPEYQEKSLLKTPFNSTFSAVTGTDIPLNRRADFIRNLHLKDTLILERKDQEAKTKLKNDFNFIL